MKTKVGYFGKFPPEHYAHALDTALNVQLLSGISEIEPVYLTQNREMGSNYMWNDTNFSVVPVPNVKIYNCYDYVQNASNSKDYGLTTFLKSKDKTDSFVSFLKDMGIDVMFIDNYPDFWEKIVNACKQSGIKSILYVDLACDNPETEPILSINNEFIRPIKEADYVVVPQPNIESTLAKYGLKGSKDISVVHKSVDFGLTERIRNRENKELYDELGLSHLYDESTLLYTYAGRLAEIKNVTSLLGENWTNVCKHVVEKRPGVQNVNPHLLITGVGENEKECAEFARKNPNFTFLKGWLSSYEDALKIKRIADVFVFPSGRELTSRTPMECMAMKTPVALCDTPSNSIYQDYAQVIYTKDWGVSKAHSWMRYQQPDDRDLVEKLIHLGRNPDYRKRLGERGYEFARKTFSPENVRAEFLDALNKVRKE